MSTARPAEAAPGVDPDVQPIRESRQEGTRGAAGARAPERAAGLLVRIVQFVVAIVVLIIVAGILLVVLDANASNSIVSEVHDWARWLTGPFDGMFSFHSADDAIAVNWGIAAGVYLVIGVLIARLLGRSYR
jgi:uncharacterized protein involved in cysteine biosynthesis